MDRGIVSGDAHGGHAYLRQAQRHLRPQAHLPSGGNHLHRVFRAGWVCDRDVAARAAAGFPRSGSRRADRSANGHHGRLDTPTSARPLHGVSVYVGGALFGGGAAAGRSLDRPSQLAAHLFHQCAVRGGFHAHGALQVQYQDAQDVALHRRMGGVPADGGSRAGAGGSGGGRRRIRLVGLAVHRDAGDKRAAAGGFRALGTATRGAFAASSFFQQQRGFGVARQHVRAGDGLVRLGAVRAYISADR